MVLSGGELLFIKQFLSTFSFRLNSEMLCRILPTLPFGQNLLVLIAEASSFSDKQVLMFSSLTVFSYQK